MAGAIASDLRGKDEENVFALLHSYVRSFVAFASCVFSFVYL